MRLLSALVLLLSVASTGWAEDKPSIALPTTPVPAPPVPGAISKLSADQFYVADSDQEWLVLCSPPGIVKITREDGPLRVKGKFVDGTGGFETRTFSKKNVWTIEAQKTALCELLFIPAGAKSEADVIRRTLDVNAGIGPRPPPDPIDPPKPPPDPADPVTSFRVFLIYESANNLTADQRGIIYGKLVEEWLDTNCTGGNKGWRRRDKDSPGENDVPMAALWAAIKPKITGVPCIAVERNGKVDILPLAESPVAMVETLKKYRGK